WFFFSSRRRHTSFSRDWSSDVCSSDLAAVGVDGEWVRNDFDSAEIFGEMGPVTDDYGNVFIRIPKLYIRKTDGPGYKTWAVSKRSEERRVGNEWGLRGASERQRRKKSR